MSEIVIISVISKCLFSYAKLSGRPKIWGGIVILGPALIFDRIIKFSNSITNFRNRTMLFCNLLIYRLPLSVTLSVNEGSFWKLCWSGKNCSFLHFITFLLSRHAFVKNWMQSSKKLIERSRVCHNHKPQPTSTPTGREKGQKHTREKQTNKCTRSTKTSSLFHKLGDQNAKTNGETRTKSTSRL